MTDLERYKEQPRLWLREPEDDSQNVLGPKDSDEVEENVVLPNSDSAEVGMNKVDTLEHE